MWCHNVSLDCHLRHITDVNDSVHYPQMTSHSVSCCKTVYLVDLLSTQYWHAKLIRRRHYFDWHQSGTDTANAGSWLCMVFMTALGDWILMCGQAFMGTAFGTELTWADDDCVSHLLLCSNETLELRQYGNDTWPWLISQACYRASVYAYKHVHSRLQTHVIVHRQNHSLRTIIFQGPG